MTLLPLSSCPAPADSNAGDIVLRPATRGDLDAIAGLENASFTTDRLTRRRIRALMASSSARLLVAERGGGLAGYVLLLTRRGSAVARLYSIAVAATEAGQGTGRRLVAAAEEAARGTGARVLRLEVRADNDRAIALYEAMGYRLIGERQRYYEDGMTALRYDKPLRETGA